MPWTLLGQSVTGTSHRSRNTPCQDAFRFRRFGQAGEWLVVAVADGTGTAAHSEVGANRACEDIVLKAEVLGPAPTIDGMIGLFGDVRESLLAEAGRLDVRPRELACTTLVAIVGPESAAVAQLGDGAIVLGDGTDYRTAFWPEPGEYANSTDFLTDERFADALLFDTVSGPTPEVAILTDGLQRVALDFSARAPHAPFFRPLFSHLRSVIQTEGLNDSLRDFLDSARINDRTDDDKTLVLGVSRP